jgi:hypothetical protein
MHVLFLRSIPMMKLFIDIPEEVASRCRLVRRHPPCKAPIACIAVADAPEQLLDLTARIGLKPFDLDGTPHFALGKTIFDPDANRERIPSYTDLDQVQERTRELTLRAE